MRKQSVLYDFVPDENDLSRKTTRRRNERSRESSRSPLTFISIALCRLRSAVFNIPRVSRRFLPARRPVALSRLGRKRPRKTVRNRSAIFQPPTPIPHSCAVAIFVIIISVISVLRGGRFFIRERNRQRALSA